MKHIIASLAFLFSCLYSLAQYDLTISGQVTGKNNQPLQFANVFLLRAQDSSLVKSGLADSLGLFRFAGISSGKFKIKASSVGYADFVSSELILNDSNAVIPVNILLTQVENTLTGVTVTAARPFLEQRTDKLIVNLNNSITSAGSTALEVLQKIPGVIIINDRVSMAGKTGVIIMINGKPSPYVDMESVIKDIPSTNIDRIEVIANPGARYEASGNAGIINLILKKQANLGFNGSFTGGGGYSYYDQKAVRSNDNSYYRYYGSLSLNFRTKRWNYFGSFDYLHRKVFEVNNYDRIINESLFKQINYYPYFYNTYNYRAGIDYSIGKKSVIGVLVNGFHRDGSGTSTTYTIISNKNDGNPVDSFITSNLTRINRSSVTGNLNFKHEFNRAGKTLNVDFDYSDYNYRNIADMNIYTAGGLVHNYQQGGNPLSYVTLKADFVQPIDSVTKIEAGFKLSGVSINNDLLFIRDEVIDPTRSNAFNYKEGVQAAYLSFEKKYKDFEWQVGLRAEGTRVRGSIAGSSVLKRNYLQLFPSIFLNKTVNSKVGLILSYSRRIDRPSFVFLSPFSFFLDSLTYFQGNPNLLPQLTHAVKFSLNYKGSPLLSTSYNYTDKVIYVNAPWQQGLVTYTFADNLGRYINFVAALNVPVNVGKSLKGYAGMQGIYNSYKTAYFDSLYHRSKWTMQSYIQLNYTITPKLKSELNAFYTSSSLNEFSVISRLWGINVGLQQSILKNKGKLSLTVNDIFYKNRTVSIVKYGPIDTRYFYRDDSRNLRLTFTYSFGNNKLAPERGRRTGSVEESNRL